MNHQDFQSGFDKATKQKDEEIKHLVHQLNCAESLLRFLGWEKSGSGWGQAEDELKPAEKDYDKFLEMFPDCTSYAAFMHGWNMAHSRGQVIVSLYTKALQLFQFIHDNPAYYGGKVGDDIFEVAARYIKQGRTP